MVPKFSLLLRLHLLLLLLPGPAFLNSLTAQELPQVLVLGDRIHREVLARAAKSLDPRIRLTTPRASDLGTVSTTLAAFDDIVGDRTWDVIYLNCGLGDLRHIAPNTLDRRALSRHAGGVVTTTEDEYRRQLESLIIRLKPKARVLLWGMTTPIVGDHELFVPHSEVRYNEIAHAIMKQQGVAIVDLHQFALEHIDPQKPPGPLDVHRKIELEQPIIEALTLHLNLTTEGPKR